MFSEEALTGNPFIATENPIVAGNSVVVTRNPVVFLALKSKTVLYVEIYCRKT